MADILYVNSYGSDDPTRATIPFVSIVGALEAGHQPQLALVGEGTYLMKDEIAEQIHGVGWAPLAELFAKVVEHEVPVYV